VIDTVTLLHLNLHRPCESLPDLDHVFLFLGAKVFIQHVDLVVDTLNQALDFEAFVGKHLDEFLSFSYLFNIDVVFSLNYFEHVVDFFSNLLLALLYFSLDLLK